MHKLRIAGWNEEESIAIIKVRYNILPQYEEKPININTVSGEKPVKFHLIALSGAFVYLLLYYLLHSTSRILLTTLQYIENDPIKNFGWLKWYIASFNLLLIFFTTSLFIKDKNLIQKLRKIKLNQFYIIFFATIFLAITDYNLLSISRSSLGNIFALKVMLTDIIQFSELIFSLVISICFLMLFNKYYRENMKTY